MQPQNPYYYAIPGNWYPPPQSQPQSGVDPQSAPGPGVMPTPAPWQGQPIQSSVGTQTNGAASASPAQGGGSAPVGQSGPWSGQPEQWTGQAATVAQGASQQPSNQGKSRQAQPQAGGQQLPAQQGGPVSAGPGRQAATVPHPAPLVDIVEEPAAIEVVVDLPGFDEDDIQLNADAQTLYVSADRAPEENEDRVAIQRERPLKVERTVTIPVHVELDEASAVHDDGVCRVTLPKSEEETGTQTKIGFH